MGTTEEIAVGVVPSTKVGGAEVEWRLSIADLGSAPSTFSTFAGVSRVFTVVGEHSVRMEFEEATHRLDPMQPLAFDGALSPTCIPLGPTKAFNVMVDSDVCTVSVTVSVLHGSIVTDPAVLTALYVCSGRIDVAGSAVADTDASVLVDRAAVVCRGRADILVARIETIRATDIPG